MTFLMKSIFVSFSFVGNNEVQLISDNANGI